MQTKTNFRQDASIQPAADVSPKMMSIADDESYHYPKIKQAAEQAHAALDELSQKSASFSKEDNSLDEAIKDVRQAFKELVEKAGVLKDKSAEVPVKALSRAVVTANNSLDNLKHAIMKFDQEQKVSESVEKTLKPAIEACDVAVAEISHYVSEAASAANAQLQGVNDTVRQKITATASSGLKFVMNALASLDVQYDIREKAKGTLHDLDEKLKIQQTAKSLNEKYEISDTAKEKLSQLDDLSKGRLRSSYEKGRKMATEGLEYLNDEFEKAVLQKKLQNLRDKSAAA